MTFMHLSLVDNTQLFWQRWGSGRDGACAELNLHGHTPSALAACCIQLMQSVPGGLLSSSMCSRLQACLASRGKGLHTDTLRIHLGTVTSPAIHGAGACLKPDARSAQSLATAGPHSPAMRLCMDATGAESRQALCCRSAGGAAE